MINDVYIPQEVIIDDYFKDYPIYQEIKTGLSTPNTWQQGAKDTI